MAEIEITKSPCNLCGRATNHEVLFRKSVSEVEELDESTALYYDTEYLFLSCRGCEDVSLKRSVKISGYGSDEQEYYYPPRISRKMPEWLMRLPSDYSYLAREVYSCLDCDNRILALVGARALLDVFISRTVGDCGTFKAGLDLLVEKNYLARANRPALEIAIEAGNAAAHRAYRPTELQLNNVIDIVENLIQHDILMVHTMNLQKSVPPRPPREVKD